MMYVWTDIRPLQPGSPTILRTDAGWYPAPGTERRVHMVVFAGIPVTCFLHRSIRNEKLWTVTEESSGLIAAEGRTRAEAMAEAEKRFRSAIVADPEFFEKLKATAASRPPRPTLR